MYKTLISIVEKVTKRLVQLVIWVKLVTVELIARHNLHTLFSELADSALN